MTKKLLYPWGICYKEVITNAVECSLCKSWIHNKCANLTLKELKNLEKEENWFCVNCARELPFFSSDKDLIYEGSHETDCRNTKLQNGSDDLNLESYDCNEYKSGDFEVNVDPSNNFFNTICTNCKYYSDVSFIMNSNKKKKGFLSYI